LIRSIRISELETNLDEILQQAQESGESIAITRDDPVIAHLVPVRRAPVNVEAVGDWLIKLDRLAAEIGAYLSDDADAVEMVRDVRGSYGDQVLQTR
jgi:antitoxin (DNA-binding transcriptional repressor) of toxin-antitoxin stability system